MAKKILDHFEVEGYEVRFLQDNPITVCVIRSLTDRSQKCTGVAVCHPSDVFDEATGRHKAMKKLLEFHMPSGNPKNSENIALFRLIYKTIRGIEPLPVLSIQRAYWEHYKESE